MLTFPLRSYNWMNNGDFWYLCILDSYNFGYGIILSKFNIYFKIIFSISFSSRYYNRLFSMNYNLSFNDVESYFLWAIEFTWKNGVITDFLYCFT